MIRLNADGTRDTGFDTKGGTYINRKTPLGIYDMALLPDNSILIVGEFKAFNGVGVNNLVHLLPDDTFDTAFPPRPPGLCSIDRCFTMWRNIPTAGCCWVE